MNGELNVIFSHGQESGPWGSKITAMAAAVRARGCVAESIDYRGLSTPPQRIAKLRDACTESASPILLVGSSMGGYVATAVADDVSAAGLFVLAPAYFMRELAPLDPSGVPTEIVHGWHDDVVPVENSFRYANQCLATLHVVDDDHRLGSSIDEINAYLLRFVDRLSSA